MTAVRSEEAVGTARSQHVAVSAKIFSVGTPCHRDTCNAQRHSRSYATRNEAFGAVPWIQQHTRTSRHLGEQSTIARRQHVYSAHSEGCAHAQM